MADLINSFNQFVQKPNVQWAIIGFQVVLVLAIILIRLYVHNKKIRKTLALYQSGKYEAMIAPATQLKNEFGMVHSQRNKRSYNQLSLMLASSALRIGDDELFHKHIQDVTDEDLEYVVLMWLTVYDLNKNDMESAERHYKQFLNAKEDDKKIISQTFLDALFTHNRNADNLMSDPFAQIGEKVNNPVMRDYLKDMINQEG